MNLRGSYTRNKHNCLSIKKMFVLLAIAFGGWLQAIAGCDCVDTSLVYDDTGAQLNAVAYHNGRYMVVGNAGLVLTSSDGTTWSSLDPGTTWDIVDVVWAGDRFAMLTSIGAQIITWTEGGGFVVPVFDVPMSGFGNSLDWDGTKLIYAYEQFESGRFRATNDWATMRIDLMDTAANCGPVTGISTVNGATVYGANCISDGISLPSGFYYSLDGFNFAGLQVGPLETYGSSPAATNGKIAFVGGTQWIFPGPTFKYIWTHTSDLGVVDFTRYENNQAELRDKMLAADWVQSAFIGVGADGDIGCSINGLSWQALTSPSSSNLRHVIPTIAGGFVAVGADGNIVIGSINPLLSDSLADWPAVKSTLDFIDTVNTCAPILP